MPEPLELDLPGELRRLLGMMAHIGLLGGSEAEVASYLVMRGVDDMMRSGLLKLESSPADLNG